MQVWEAGLLAGGSLGWQLWAFFTAATQRSPPLVQALGDFV